MENYARFCFLFLYIYILFNVYMQPFIPARLYLHIAIYGDFSLRRSVSRFPTIFCVFPVGFSFAPACCQLVARFYADRLSQVRTVLILRFNFDSLNWPKKKYVVRKLLNLITHIVALFAKEKVWIKLSATLQHFLSSGYFRIVQDTFFFLFYVAG